MKRLALFARPPETGRVKTRLSPALPADLACRVYGAMLDDAFATLDAAGADERYVWWSDAAPSPPAPPSGWRVELQTGSDLGARLAHAFSTLLMGGAHAVIVGADCPALGAQQLNGAVAALDDHDVVFGPARDGGYYLIGLRSPQPALFEGIAWSTASVLAASLERAHSARLRVRLLEELDDLDTPADLVTWIARTAFEPDRSRLRATLAAMGLAPPA